MLVLAVHNLTETSAKIPFAMVVLLDCISKKLHPVQLKCRQVGALSRANCPPHERPRQQLRGQAAPQISPRWQGMMFHRSVLLADRAHVWSAERLRVGGARRGEPAGMVRCACLKRSFAKHDLQIFHAGPYLVVIPCHRLDDLLETDCKTEVFEIQEQFAIGLFTDVQRAADQVRHAQYAMCHLAPHRRCITTCTD